MQREASYPQDGIPCFLFISDKYRYCLLLAAGVGISYLVVVGDLLPDVMKQILGDKGSILCERSTWVVFTTIFVLAPLASLRCVWVWVWFGKWV